MLTPFILFVGLILATAVIAYWSDNLGKKLGKKRVSLFGLRPRTTATLLTVTSSWGIMLFTLLFLLATVTPLRNALFRYDSDRAQYKKDIGEAQEQLTSTKNQLNQTQSTFERTQFQLKNARLSLANARQDATKARKDAQEAEAEGKRRAAQAQQRAAEAQKHASEAQKRFVTAQAKFNDAQHRFEEAQRRANQAQGREQIAREGERQAENLARQARANLEKARHNLDTTRVNLRDANAKLQTARISIQNANQTIIRAGVVAKNLGQTILALDQQRLQLTRELDLYQNVTDQLGGGKIEIAVGRTFAAGIIESGKSQKRIEENLRQLLVRAREALPSFETAPGARLELLPLPEIVDGKLTLLEDEAIYERLAREVVKNEDATSVRLVAARNFTEGETVIDARFVAVPVATAFHSGEELATAVINGQSGDAAVFNKLLALTDAGRFIALRRKVNPPQSPQEPNFYAAGTNVALFAALRRIEANGGIVKVRLIAADDLLTVEPLRVKFVIDGEEENN